MGARAYGRGLASGTCGGDPPYTQALFGARDGIELAKDSIKLLILELPVGGVTTWGLGWLFAPRSAVGAESLFGLLGRPVSQRRPVGTSSCLKVSLKGPAPHPLHLFGRTLLTFRSMVLQKASSRSRYSWLAGASTQV